MAGNRNQKIKNILVTLGVPVIIFLIMEAICVITNDVHLITSILDVNNMIRNVGITCGLAYALSFNLSCGRFDLSLGAQRMVGVIIGGSIALSLGLSGIWLVVFSIISGLFFGFIIGMIFIIMRVPPMVLGIGMGLIYECIAFMVNGSEGLSLFGVEGVSILVNPTFVILVVAVMCIGMYVLTTFTKFGYQLKAIQGSQRIAQNSGINIFKHTVCCYSFAGIVVSISGIISAAMTNSMNASLGFASNGTVMTACFPMMLGNVLGKWSNSSIGILSATVAIRFLNLGLTKLELSESLSNVINMLAFLALLIFQANQYIFETKQNEKARIEQAMEKKKQLKAA